MYQLKTREGLTLAQIAEIICAELRGDPAIRIVGVCSLDEPAAGHIAFSQSAKIDQLASGQKLRCLGALVVPHKAKELESLTGFNLLFADEPLAAMVKIVRQLYTDSPPQYGVHKSACIDPSAVIEEAAIIGPFSVIGANSVIGQGSVLFSHVVVYPEVHIGKRVTVHAGAIIREGVHIGDGAVIQNGAVIGADGFGYIPSAAGLEPIPHVGALALGQKVEVGANACIDRATFGTARVGKGSKIDNLVQVGHNANIGDNVILCGCTGIAGSCNIESGAVIGGKVGIADHITIKSGVRVAGASVVTGNLLTPGDYGGYPAQPVTEWRRQRVALKKLPRLLARIRKLDEE